MSAVHSIWALMWAPLFFIKWALSWAPLIILAMSASATGSATFWRATHTLLGWHDHRISLKVPNTRHGGTGLYQCKDGFILKGQNTTQCDFGNWTGETPICELVYCPFPGYIEGGKVKSLQSCAPTKVDQSVLGAFGGQYGTLRLPTLRQEGQEQPPNHVWVWPRFQVGGRAPGRHLHRRQVGEITTK